MAPSAPKTIDEYIAGFPAEVQPILQKVRQTINRAAPRAEETIAYGMPGFNLNGKYLVYFAGTKKHVGFYGAPRNDPAFPVDLTPYESGAGTLQFPYDQRVPFGLITKIVKFRVKESNAKAKARQKPKAKKKQE
jgi:uncharacterized protein YdhG (YjbR/CyaY superfamily)